MKKIKLALYRSLKTGWALLQSALIGAIDKIELEVNRPQAKNWNEFIANDIRLYFAPFTGAISDVAKRLKDTSK